MNTRQILILINSSLLCGILILHFDFLMMIGLLYITVEAYNGAKSKEPKNV